MGDVHAMPAKGDLPTLREVESQYIQRVLAATGGSKRRAASILGITRWSLARRLRKLGLEPEHLALVKDR